MMNNEQNYYKLIFYRLKKNLPLFFTFVKQNLPPFLTFLFGLGIIFYVFFSDKIDFNSYLNKSLQTISIPSQIISSTPAPTQTTKGTLTPTQTGNNTTNPSQPISSVNNFLSLISPSLISLIVFAIKLLAGFWIFVLVLSILKWGRISEQGAKIFGVEINQKFTNKEWGIAKTSLDQAKKQIQLLSDLNGLISDYLARYSKKSVEESYSILEGYTLPKKIYQAIMNILKNAYQKTFPEVEIYVLPIDEELTKLPPRIKAAVFAQLEKEDKDVLLHIENSNLGIGIHRVHEGLETIIIIDTSQAGYEISLAEIESAGNLFLSISNTFSDT